MIRNWVAGLTLLFTLAGRPALAQNGDTPPQKAYADFNDAWPIDSWEVTEPSISYQTAYIRLLSRFVGKTPLSRPTPRRTWRCRRAGRPPRPG